MSFSMDPGVKYHLSRDHHEYEACQKCYCFFHAIQRVVKGERIVSEVYDGDDEYDTPGVCPDCLAEEKK